MKTNIQVVVTVGLLSVAATIAVGIMSQPVQAQTVRRTTCCSNVWAYARGMEQVITKVCPDLGDDDVKHAINQFLRSVDQDKLKMPHANGTPCFSGRSRTVVDGIRADPSLCFAPEDLFKKFVPPVKAALAKCPGKTLNAEGGIPEGGVADAGVGDADSNVLSEITIQNYLIEILNCANCNECGDAGDQDVMEIIPEGPEAGVIQGPPPFDQSIAITTGVDQQTSMTVGSAVMMHDTRPYAMNLPISYGQSQTYAAFTARVKPYQLKMYADGELDKVESSWSFAKAVSFAFGATESPTWIENDSDTKEAFGLGLDIFNQRDAFLNQGFADCLKLEWAKLLQNNKTPNKDDMRTVMEKCIVGKVALGLSYGTQEALYHRFALQADWTIASDWNLVPFLALTTYKDAGYVPFELGARMSYSDRYVNFFVDSAALYAVGDTEDVDPYRGTFSFGTSLPMGGGYNVGAQARLIPDSWEPDGTDLHWVAVLSLGFAGNDLSLMYAGEKLRHSFKTSAEVEAFLEAQKTSGGESESADGKTQ